MHSTIQRDLERIREFDLPLWESLRGKKIFATGCTGFIGSWFVHSFCDLNEKLNLNASLTLLTRNKHKLEQKFKGLNFDVVEGNILDFPFPEGQFDYVIHGATEVSSYQTGANPADLLEVSYLGTKRIIDFSKIKKASRVLFLSSGAVYGKAPNGLGGIPEDYSGAPGTSDINSFYGEGKRLGEMLLFNEKNFESVSARIFAASGPFLPLESEFAFSNFLKACLSNEDIIIKSNGKTTRSYLYGADLVLWLWTILVKGKNRTNYNVGSEKEISIFDLAKLICSTTEASCQITVKGHGEEYSRYFPSTARARLDLGLREITSLEDSIINSFNFYKGQS